MQGVAPFERLLDEGVGARIYVAARQGAAAPPCPFCRHPMHGVPPGTDAPPGITVCHLCEQVWLPHAASEWMASHTSRSPASTVPAHPARCDDCGAPWSPDNRGQCRFCRAQLTAPLLVPVSPM